MAEEQQAQQQYRRQDAIIKPEQDFRQYRGLTLENGMKVLLVHDPDTDKSAAAMEVNIGKVYQRSRVSRRKKETFHQKKKKKK